jgi:hypothetical protein
MPLELAAWGCDEELWGKIKGAKGSLRKLARDGDETRGRARLANIRQIVAEEEANPTAAKKRVAVRPKGPGSEERAKAFTNPRAANAKGARPLSAGYELFGPMPEGFDGDAAEALVSDGSRGGCRREGWARRAAGGAGGETELRELRRGVWLVTHASEPVGMPGAPGAGVVEALVPYGSRPAVRR